MVMVVVMVVVMLMGVCIQVASRCLCLEMGMDVVCCCFGVLLGLSLSRLAWLSFVVNAHSWSSRYWDMEMFMSVVVFMVVCGPIVVIVLVVL